MTLLNTLVYDSTQKVSFDYAMAALTFLLMMLGIFLLRASKINDISRLKPGMLMVVWLFLLKAHPRKNKIYGRIALVTSVLIAILYIYNYMFVKKPELFYDLNHFSGRIDKVEEKNAKGQNHIRIQVNGETFFILQDKGYVGTKTLTTNDSVTIRYYRETKPHLTTDENKKIVRLEVE